MSLLKLGPLTSGLSATVLALVTAALIAPAAQASDITIASPVNGQKVTSPVWLRAHNIGCDGLTPSAFGYSIDNSSQLIRGVTNFDVDTTNSSMGAGTHTIHYKSWTTKGECPVASTTFTVDGSTPKSAPSEPSSIPSNAASEGDLEQRDNWEWKHDPATPGSSQGSSVYPASAGSEDGLREFYFTYHDHGGEIYHLTFGHNTSATHFVYDTYIYLKDPSQTENIEMDMNQVLSDGSTVIYGTQCASGTNTWEFTTVSGGSTHWRSSNIHCNPKSWSANTWHHVQIASHRNGSGDVTYDWVNLDNTHSTFSNANGFSALHLGWPAGDLILNFQLDGALSGEGSVTAYIHKTTIYSW